MLNAIKELPNFKYKIAIVGGGASGVTFIHYLIERIIKNSSLHPIEITVFEPKDIGSGLAYQDDFDCALLNVRAQAMMVENSIIGNFADWCSQKGYAIDQLHKSYLPRNLFGLYLKQLFEATIKLAKPHNIELRHIQEEVVDIKKEDNYKITTSSFKNIFYDFVMLCVGNTQADDYYNLVNKVGYIHKPYPLKEALSGIDKQDRVAILGSGLTAIDIAISLIKNGHQSDIHMYSRNGIFPSVRGITNDYKMHYMHKEALNEIISKKKFISLKDIYKILRKELKNVGVNAKEIFTIKSVANMFNHYISAEIQNAAHTRHWQSVMIATNNIIEEYWHALNDRDKDYFIKNFHSTWMTRRCPMPLLNANKIKKAADSGQLYLKEGIQYVNMRDRKFFITTKNKITNYYYWVINATGPARNVKMFPSDLMKNMMNRGDINEHQFGGIVVDFDTAAIIDKKGTLHTNFRAIGHITCGTYYYVSSYVMISRKSKQIAQEVARMINKHDGNNNEN